MNVMETSPHVADMPTAVWSKTDQTTDDLPPLAARQLNRICAVREQQGISLRTIARGRRVPLRQVQHEENPHSDLHLSTIYDWQHYLEVPVADLLVESEDSLSRPVMERARMLKIMKTIATIRERAEDHEDDDVKQLGQTLFDQAVEMMPELIDVLPWQRVGQRRTLSEFGRAAEHQVPDDFFASYDG
jgi:hypothetical protein